MDIFVDLGEHWMACPLTSARLPTVSSTIFLVTNLGHYSVDEWTGSWLKGSWMVGLKGQWLMDRVYLEAGDSGVPQGSALGPLLYNVTGAAWSDVSDEPAGTGTSRAFTWHSLCTAVNFCIVERICLEMMLSFCFWKPVIITQVAFKLLIGGTKHHWCRST